MAEGKPPHSNEPTMRVIFNLPKRPSPHLSQPEKWSDAFNHFVSRCLDKSPITRASTAELLQHPFITRGVPERVMKDFAKKALTFVDKHRSALAKDIKRINRKDDEERDR